MAVATGVGVVFNPVVPPYLDRHGDSVDFLEVIPETLWTDRGRSAEHRYEPVAAAVAEVAALARRYPIAVHGIGLSIGSATPLDERHLSAIRRFVDTYEVTRISEHLGFTRVPGHVGDDRHMGLGFPVPCDDDVLAWMIERVERAMTILGQRLILENGVRHTPLIDEDMSEPVFLNRLADATGCGVLLDLHNLHTDHRNGGRPPADYVAELDLAHVREIHIAGGSVIGRAYTDSHAGPCPPEVWELLADVAPRCPNLEGITFEFHDSYYPRMGEAGLEEQLRMVRRVWRTRTAAHVA